MLKVNQGEQLQANMAIKTLYHLVLACLTLLLMVGCTASPATPPSSNGGELATYQINIDLLGAKNEAVVDIQGRLKTTIQVTSTDGTIGLSIDGDTILLDEDEKPLQLIEATVVLNLPPPREDTHIVSTVYDLKPSGATFNPPLKLFLSYDPDELPQGLREGDVYIAGYEDGEWHKLGYKQVDTEKHSVATRIDHFARYAVLAPIEQPTEGPPSTSGSPSTPANRVEVVYFHRNQRCAGCVYAETGTRYTVETYFKDELASGKVTFETLNVEDDKNAAIIKKYDAYTSSLFINTITDGTDHIEEVTEIWFVLGDDEAFAKVVRSKIEESLKG